MPVNLYLWRVWFSSFVFALNSIVCHFAFSQYNYSHDGRKLWGLITAGQNLCVLHSVWVADNSERRGFGDASISLHLYYRSGGTWVSWGGGYWGPWIPLHGPHDEGLEDDGRAKWEWSDGERVNYSNAGLFSWDDWPGGDQVLFEVQEGDEDPNDDDIMMQEVAYVDELRRPGQHSIGNTTTVELIVELFTDYPPAQRSYRPRPRR